MLRDLRENRNGLVGHWLPAWETPALVDASGRGKTATNSGSTIVSSSRGHVRSFDGVNDGINVAGSIIPTGDEAKSIATWFMTTTSIGTRQWLVYAGGESANGRFSLEINGSKFRFNYYSAAQIHSQTLVANRWYFGCVTYEKAATTSTLYVDGRGETASLFAGALDTDATSTNRLGNINSGTWLNGLMGDVRFYNRALPAAEVRDLYERTREPYTPRRDVYSVTAAPTTKTYRLFKPAILRGS